MTTLKVKVNGVEIEGEKEDVFEFAKMFTQKNKEQTITPQPKIDTSAPVPYNPGEKQFRPGKTKKNWNAIYATALQIIMRGEAPVTYALKMANDNHQVGKIQQLTFREYMKRKLGFEIKKGQVLNPKTGKSEYSQKKLASIAANPHVMIKNHHKVDWPEVYKNALPIFVKGGVNIYDALRQANNGKQADSVKGKEFRAYLADNGVKIPESGKFTPKAALAEKERKAALIAHEANKGNPSVTEALAQARAVIAKTTTPQKTKVDVKLLDDAPYMNTIKDQKLFLEIVRHVIGNKSKMTYRGDSYSLSLETPQQWTAFVDEFMTKKDRLLTFFLAKGSFVKTFDLHNNRAVIEYHE